MKYTRILMYCSHINHWAFTAGVSQQQGMAPLYILPSVNATILSHTVYQVTESYILGEDLCWGVVGYVEDDVL